MTEGERIEQEWQSDWDRQDEPPMWHIADLARRIDAALAEREAQIARLTTAYENSQTANLQKEAQIAALREQLSEAYDILTQTDDDEAARAVDRVLTETADAAHAFVARLQAEERERCAQVVEHGCDLAVAARLNGHHWEMAAAIRALK